jgi:hypothetical protein
MLEFHRFVDLAYFCEEGFARQNSSSAIHFGAYHGMSRRHARRSLSDASGA